MQQDANGTTKNLLYLLSHAMNSPYSLVLFLMSTIGYKTSLGDAFTVIDVAIFLITTLVGLAILYFLTWALPRLYFTLLTFCIAIVISILSTGWCLNETTKCEMFYIDTRDKVLGIRNFIETVMEIAATKKN